MRVNKWLGARRRQSGDVPWPYSSTRPATATSGVAGLAEEDAPGQNLPSLVILCRDSLGWNKLCKSKVQQQLTWKESSYCLLALYDSTLCWCLLASLSYCLLALLKKVGASPPPPVSDSYTSKHKPFVYYFYNVGPTSKTLGRRFINVTQMFCFCWDMPGMYL